MHAVCTFYFSSGLLCAIGRQLRWDRLHAGCLIKVTTGGLAAVRGHIFVSRYQREMSGWVPAPARWTLSWYNPLISFILCAPRQLRVGLCTAAFSYWHIMLQESQLHFNIVVWSWPPSTGLICANNPLFDLNHTLPFWASPGDYETTETLLSHISPVYRKSELWVSGMWTHFPKIKQERIYAAIFVHIDTTQTSGDISFIYEIIHGHTESLTQQIARGINRGSIRCLRSSLL